MKTTYDIRMSIIGKSHCLVVKSLDFTFDLILNTHTFIDGQVRALMMGLLLLEWDPIFSRRYDEISLVHLDVGQAKSSS